jgi:Putative Ig domain
MCKSTDGGTMSKLKYMCELLFAAVWMLTPSTLPGQKPVPSSVRPVHALSGGAAFALAFRDAKAAHSASFAVTPPAAGIEIIPPALPDGIAGALYSTTLAANGGRPPYTWSASALPPGLVLSTSGSLTGTIAAPGTYLVRVTVRDAASLAASKNFTLEIDLPPGLVITTKDLPNGTAGVNYTPIFLTASGGTPPYVWSIARGELPKGMSLSADGTLSGIPQRGAVYSIAVQVTDSATNSATLTYSLTVTAQ